MFKIDQDELFIVTGLHNNCYCEIEKYDVTIAEFSGLVRIKFIQHSEDCENKHETKQNIHPVWLKPATIAAELIYG